MYEYSYVEHRAYLNIREWKLPEAEGNHLIHSLGPSSSITYYGVEMKEMWWTSSRDNKFLQNVRKPNAKGPLWKPEKTDDNIKIYIENMVRKDVD
jgi:hypothetical protein